MSLRSGARPLLVAALLVSVVIVGVGLRLKDPLSTRALGAEDPYTHVVFTKEWLSQGYFADSFHLGTTMYPPGMHAFIGAFAPLAGVSLYDFARVAPALFGALAILGAYALGARLGGQAAGLGAAVLMALTPELIFRTELLFPTALDLALLPLWILAFHLAISSTDPAHRTSGRILFVATGIPIAIMHPWLVPLFGVPLALFAALTWRRSGAPARELGLSAALLVVPVAFAMAFRWDESDTGFADFAAKVPGLQWIGNMALPGPLLFVILLAILGVIAFAAVALVTRLPRGGAPHGGVPHGDVPHGGVPRGRVPRIVALVVGAGLLALVIPLSQTPPFGVDYGTMLGPLTIGLACAGYLLAFWRPTPLGDLGACIATLLMPLTAFDVFDSEFWPQRTVAYLAFGAVLLGASAVGAAHEAMTLLASRSVARGRSSVGVATACLVAVGLILAGSAAATSKPMYTWYRLYNEDHFRGFETIADIVDDDPDARVVIYTWQPALMVKTLIEPRHVWYSPKFYNDGAERGEILVSIDGPAYVLVDKHTQRAEEAGKADLGFLHDGSKYREVYESGDGRLLLYEVIG